MLILLGSYRLVVIAWQLLLDIYGEGRYYGLSPGRWPAILCRQHKGWWDPIFLGETIICRCSWIFRKTHFWASTKPCCDDLSHKQIVWGCFATQKVVFGALNGNLCAKKRGGRTLAFLRNVPEDWPTMRQKSVFLHAPC